MQAICGYVLYIKSSYFWISFFTNLTSIQYSISAGNLNFLQFTSHAK
jgi:hypothetical protein